MNQKLSLFIVIITIATLAFVAVVDAVRHPTHYHTVQIHCDNTGKCR